MGVYQRVKIECFNLLYILFKKVPIMMIMFYNKLMQLNTECKRMNIVIRDCHNHNVTKYIYLVEYQISPACALSMKNILLLRLKVE